MTDIFVFYVNMFQSNRAFWLLYNKYFLASTHLTTYTANVLKSVMNYVVLLFQFCVAS